MNNEEVLSKSISLLRVPLACLVVLGHADPIKFNPVINGEVVDFSFDVIQYPITFLSWVLFAPAVPLFFYISGFLFFWKIEKFDTVVYKEKICKRLKSLIIPYFMWNFLFLILILSKCLYHGDYNQALFSLMGLWIVPEHLHFVLSGSMTTPIDGPLWFMRDLIVMTLLTPIIYKVIKNCTVFYYFILFMGVWYLFFPHQYIFPGLSVPALLFFCIGAYGGINKINFLDSVRGNLGIILISVFTTLCVIDLITSDYSNLHDNTRTIVGIESLHKLMTILGIVSYIILASACVDNKSFKATSLSRLGGVSFVIFAFHMPIIPRLWKVVIPLLSLTNCSMQLVVFVSYLIVFLICVVLSLVIYRLLGYSSLLNALFTGNR